MKQLFITIISVAIFLSCNKKDKEIPKSVAVEAIVDITDPPLALNPNTDAILRLYQFDTDENREASFKLCLITDRQLNKTEEFHLSDAISTEADNRFDDPQNRQKLILAFYQSVRKGVTDFTAALRTDSPLPYSECFKTIARELSEMKQKHATENMCLIFSDLRENAELFSSYTKKGKGELNFHPEKLTTLFEQTQLLPDDLKGFGVVFVFEPRNREEDKAYAAMSNIYKSLLEKRGARVTVTANTKNYIP